MTKPIHAQVDDYLEYCRSIRQMSSMTLRSKDHTYKHFIVGSECKDLRELDNKNFNRWISYQTSNGVSARTINTRMAHILSMLRYHREMGMDMPIKLPLIKKLKEDPITRVHYTREQIEDVLRYADELAWLLIKISFDTGFRISELRNLTLSNLHPHENGLRVKFVGKGRKDRESYISHEACFKLRKWIAKRGVEDFIWVNERGRHYSVDELRIRMRKPFEEAGFDNFYPHALRHSFGTDIQKHGASLLEMQQMLGHSNAETTQRYIHGLDGKLGSLFEKYKKEDPSEDKRPVMEIPYQPSNAITDEDVLKAMLQFIKKEVQADLITK